MSDDPRDRDAVQREVATLLLSVIGEDGFVLAGAGAIREHALTDRPTEDIDLFGMPLTTVVQFASVVERAETTLIDAGFQVVRERSFAQFARLHLSKNGLDVLDVDLALNSRADPPVLMGVGPVLSERDAIAGKLSAVYSRGEVRDFLDLDSIRSTGRHTDDELLALGREHDDGFDTGMFAAQLSRVASLLPSEAAKYGVGAEDFAAAQGRLIAWATELRDPPQTPATETERVLRPAPITDQRRRE